MFDKALKFILPHHCLRCQKVGCALCDSCKNYIIKHRKYDKNLSIESSVACELRCFAWRSGLIERIVDNYKFDLKRELAGPLAQILATMLADLSSNVIVVSIPTTKNHNRTRGFDHMKLVGKELAKILGARYEVMFERRHQVSQLGLSRTERIKNAKSSFILTGKVNQKATYVVIDDVLTTGATLATVTDKLRKAGVQKLIAVVACRQPDPRLNKNGSI